MAFNIALILARGDPTMLVAARRRWPAAATREIYAPFRGFGIATADLTKGSYEQMERMHRLSFDMRDGLPDWSRKYPATEFVYIEADCFGGNCHYEGYVCRDGTIVHSEPKESGECAQHALAGLVHRLGVRLDDGYFEPLTRGFFRFDSRRRQ